MATVAVIVAANTFYTAPLTPPTLQRGSTPTPTVEPTLNPTSTAKQPSGFLGTNLPLEYGYAIVAVLVIIIVAGLSLVCLKKLGKQKVNS